MNAVMEHIYTHSPAWIRSTFLRTWGKPWVELKEMCDRVIESPGFRAKCLKRGARGNQEILRGPERENIGKSTLKSFLWSPGLTSELNRLGSNSKQQPQTLRSELWDSLSPDQAVDGTHTALVWIACKWLENRTYVKTKTHRRHIRNYNMNPTRLIAC